MEGRSVRYKGCWIVAAVVVALALCAGAMFLTTYTVFDRPHREFLRKVSLGMAEAQVESAMGAPRETVPFRNRDDVFGQFGTHMYWHTWEGRGIWPEQFDHVALYHAGSAWGEHLFYDDNGVLICIVSGRT